MSAPIEVLVLDDEEIVCDRLKVYLEKNGCNVEAFTISQEAMERLVERSFDVVITDLKMKAPTGIDILHFVRDHSSSTQVIIITGYPTIEAVREAEYGNVFDFINKPFQMDKLHTMVKKAHRRAQRLKGKAEA